MVPCGSVFCKFSCTRPASKRRTRAFERMNTASESEDCCWYYGRGEKFDIRVLFGEVRCVLLVGVDRLMNWWSVRCCLGVWLGCADV